MSESIRIIEEGPVLRVRLARADRRNAFDEDLIESLAQAFDQIAELPDVRLVILEGEGTAFCAGADLQWMQRAAGYSEEQNRSDALRMAAMFRSVSACPVPLLARVQGAALGGGMGLLAASDVAVASADAVFGFTEVRLGIIPAVISPYIMRKSTPALVRRYMLSGERFGAEEARRLGLVDVVAPTDELDEAVRVMTDALLAGAPGAQREAKELLGTFVPVEDIVTERTAAWIARVRVGAEAQEGFRAFFDRRPLPWAVDPKGRGDR